MAHAVTASGTPPARSNEPLNADSVRRARIDLAACLRWAARNGLEEGICNHFSAVLPERPDLFLVNPYGLAFAEVTAATSSKGTASRRRPPSTSMPSCTG